MKKVENQYGYGAKISTKKNSKHTKLTNADKATHAEEMALDKIYLKKTKKIINVSIIVIRITPSSTATNYKLANSRPCLMCMHKIKNTTSSGYRVTNVYFSDNNGQILKYKLRDLVKEKQHISKFYRFTHVPKMIRDEFDDDDPNKFI